MTEIIGNDARCFHGYAFGATQHIGKPGGGADPESIGKAAVGDLLAVFLLGSNNSLQVFPIIEKGGHCGFLFVNI